MLRGEEPENKSSAVSHPTSDLNSAILGLSKNAQKREKKRLAYVQKREERARERKESVSGKKKKKEGATLMVFQLKKMRENAKNSEQNFSLRMALLVRRKQKTSNSPSHMFALYAAEQGEKIRTDMQEQRKKKREETMYVLVILQKPYFIFSDSLIYSVVPNLMNCLIEPTIPSAWISTTTH